MASVKVYTTGFNTWQVLWSIFFTPIKRLRRGGWPRGDRGQGLSSARIMYNKPYNGKIWVILATGNMPQKSSTQLPILRGLETKSGVSGKQGITN